MKTIYNLLLIIALSTILSTYSIFKILQLDNYVKNGNLSSIEYDTKIVPKRDVNSTEDESGIAACLYLLDDTIILYEWIAYHYTTLPLSSLVIGLDPKTSNESIADLNVMIHHWKDVDLPIQIWENPPPKESGFNMNIGQEHEKRQAYFIWNCTHHFKKEKKEKWLLLTDSDEFISYNYIKSGENKSFFDGFLEFRTAPSKEEVINRRAMALPIRKKLPQYEHKTIVTFLEDQMNNSSQSYFKNWRRRSCIRLVGLTFGTTVTNENKHELLMTRKYRSHQKLLHGEASKVLLQLSGDWKRNRLKDFETIHNPFPRLCGENGSSSSGQDFMSAVLKYSHYVGSLESWMERGGFTGDYKGIRNSHTLEIKNQKSAPYEENLDDSMAYWFDDFLLKVGEETAEKLLLRPIQNKIDIVRKMHNLTKHTNEVQ